jgi:hypothetical protein
MMDTAVSWDLETGARQLAETRHFYEVSERVVEKASPSRSMVGVGISTNVSALQRSSIASSSAARLHTKFVGQACHSVASL